MSKRKKKPVKRTTHSKRTRNGSAAPAASAPSGASGATHLVIEKPAWNEQTGELRWKGRVVLALPKKSDSARELVREFDGEGWIWIVRDPIEPGALGDATQERRHAIQNLNDQQWPQKSIHFFSVRGNLVGWCPAQWTVAGPDLNDRST